MKKYVICGLFVFITVIAYSKDKDSINFKNEVGLVVTDLIDGSFQFTYERAAGKHISVKLGAAYKDKNGLVSLSGLDRDHIKTNDLTYSGLKIIPEFRYYLGHTQKKQLDGFYFGAYIKYSKFQSNLVGTYISSSERVYTLDFDAKMNISTLGLMVGYKLPLSKRFNLDFLIAGPGQSWHNYSIKSKLDVPDEFYDDLTEALKKYSIYDLLKSGIHFSSKNKRTTFGMPTFRYSMTLGFKF